MWDKAKMRSFRVASSSLNRLVVFLIALKGGGEIPEWFIHTTSRVIGVLLSLGHRLLNRFPTDGLCCSSQKQGSSFMSFLTKTTTEHEGKRGMKWNAVYFKQEGLNGTGSVQLCNVQNVSPDVTKEGTRVPFGKHKMPSRICVGLSYLISAAPSSFSIIRKWLLIRRRSILCQRVYKWPQHTLAASPPVMGLMSGRHAYILCNSLSLTDSALSYAT